MDKLIKREIKAPFKPKVSGSSIDDMVANFDKNMNLGETVIPKENL